MGSHSLCVVRILCSHLPGNHSTGVDTTQLTDLCGVRTVHLAQLTFPGCPSLTHTPAPQVAYPVDPALLTHLHHGVGDDDGDDGEQEVDEDEHGAEAALLERVLRDVDVLLARQRALSARPALFASKPPATKEKRNSMTRRPVTCSGTLTIDLQTVIFFHKFSANKYKPTTKQPTTAKVKFWAVRRPDETWSESTQATSFRIVQVGLHISLGEILRVLKRRVVSVHGWI